MFPLIANAQNVGIDSNDFITTSISNFGGWVNTLGPILVGLAMVVFFYGIVKYIWGAADGKGEAKTIMIWGVIALAVMVSVWGLVGLLQGFIGVDKVGNTNINIEVPTVDNQSN